MNPSLALLAQYLRKEPKEVETAWRDAKQFRKTEGGKDYRLAWKHLGKLLKVPPLPPAMACPVPTIRILGSSATLHEVGAVFMKVETIQGNTFLIPSCFLLVDGNNTTHDIPL